MSTVVSLSKVCTKCKVEKSISEFGSDKRAKDAKQSACLNCYRILKKKYRQEHKEIISTQKKRSNEKNKKTIAANSKTYQKDNKETIAEYQTVYRNNNKETHAKYCKKYNREKYHNNIQFRLASILRSRLWSALKGNWKVGSAVRDMGCTIAEGEAHLESLFTEGMNWGNWGKYGWHIDHIIPLSSFDLTDRKQLLEAVHYTNLQPLWAEDNLSKGSSL